MGSIVNIYIKKEQLEMMLKGVNAKGEKGISIDLSISDKVNNFGQNVSGYVSQTKEQRDAGKEKYYVANGKVSWTDGKISVPSKDATQKQSSVKQEPKKSEVDDLPF